MGVWGSVADGTVVVTPGAGGGADYGAALRAVREQRVRQGGRCSE